MLELGPRAVVVTGGHSEEMVDLFFDGERLVEIPGERHPDGAAHGSGCTHSSALAARLALGDEPLEAARRAREVASAAVGPVCATSAPAPARSTSSASDEHFQSSASPKAAIAAFAPSVDFAP